MAIKQLLVGFDGNTASRNAVRQAVQMADKYGASITGIHIFRPETFESHIRRWIPDDVMAQMQNVERNAEKEIEQAFRGLIAESGFGGTTDWISAQGSPVVMLPRYARYFDLMLVGQFTQIARTERQSLAPEDLLLRAGTPIIVVPMDYTVRPFKEQAAVAWDGSRSAARALTDAMQILETKNKLAILTVNGDAGGDKIPPELDIVAHLAAHGVDAERINLSETQGGVGAAIIRYCADNDPDVLVMGAYGRGKFVDMLFGGTTRHVLEGMTVPILMSH